MGTPERVSSVGDVGHAPSFLRYAAQPDVVLSQERDLYYANTLLGEGAADLAEALLGPRRAMMLAPELRALASCLYFGLTNLAGKQTLGQEYCGVDLMMAAGGGRSAGPSPLSKTSLRAYTFVRVALPYLQERMREGWHGLWSLRDPFGGGGAAAALAAAARARARARAALAPPVGIAVSAARTGETAAGRAELEEKEEEEEEEEEEETGEEEVDHGVARTELVDGPASSRRGIQATTPVETGHHHRHRHYHRSQPPSSATLAVVVVRRWLHRVLSWARRRRPAMSGVLEWALRLHLAAFYFDGRFANLAMRTVGARLAYTRTEQEAPRTRYAVLGVLLLLQVAAEAAAASAETVERWRAAAGTALSERFYGGAEAAARGGGAEDGHAGLGHEQGVTALPPPRVPAVAPDRTAADAALFPPSQRRCSLCMSNRENAAATPCGHLFCWECIVGWCQTNPECPLCRQPASPQSILCLYQYA